MSNLKIIVLGYDRVSGKKQVKKGDSLVSQEARIKEYTRLRGYPPLTAMFTDDEASETTYGRASRR